MAKFVLTTWAACLARQKPVSTRANPACMKMTRIAPITTHSMLRLPPTSRRPRSGPPPGRRRRRRRRAMTNVAPARPPMRYLSPRFLRMGSPWFEVRGPGSPPGRSVRQFRASRVSAAGHGRFRLCCVLARRRASSAPRAAARERARASPSRRRDDAGDGLLVELAAAPIAEREAVDDLAVDGGRRGRCGRRRRPAANAAVERRQGAGTVPPGDRARRVPRRRASLSNCRRRGRLTGSTTSALAERPPPSARPAAGRADARPSARGTCRRPRRRATWRRWPRRCRSRPRSACRRSRASRPSLSRQATSTSQWSGVTVRADGDADRARPRQRLDEPGLAGELVGLVGQQVADGRATEPRRRRRGSSTSASASARRRAVGERVGVARRAGRGGRAGRRRGRAAGRAARGGGRPASWRRRAR